MLELCYRLLAVVTLLVLIVPCQSEAQQSQISYGAESSVYAGSDGDLPFWMYAGKDASTDPSSANVLNRLYSFYRYSDSSRAEMLPTRPYATANTTANSPSDGSPVVAAAGLWAWFWLVRIQALCPVWSEF